MEITLEKTYQLLEKLADYVMTEIPAIKDSINRLEQRVDRLEEKVDRLEQRVGRLEQRMDSHERKINIIIEGQDAQAKQLDIIRIDMRAELATLDLHEHRIGNLEETNYGSRIRDAEND